jgi:hypothetical protein
MGAAAAKSAAAAVKTAAATDVWCASATAAAAAPLGARRHREGDDAGYGHRTYAKADPRHGLNSTRTLA